MVHVRCVCSMSQVCLFEVTGVCSMSQVCLFEVTGVCSISQVFCFKSLVLHHWHVCVCSKFLMLLYRWCPQRALSQPGCPGWWLQRRRRPQTCCSDSWTWTRMVLWRGVRSVRPWPRVVCPTLCWLTYGKGSFWDLWCLRERSLVFLCVCIKSAKHCAVSHIVRIPFETWCLRECSLASQCACIKSAKHCAVSCMVRVLFKTCGICLSAVECFCVYQICQTLCCLTYGKGSFWDLWCLRECSSAFLCVYKICQTLYRLIYGKFFF